MNGWTGRILHVDLSARRLSVETPPLERYERFLGGKGLAGFYLAPHITAPWDAPEMPVVLMTGPLVGTPSPTSGRMTIASRSPLTGTIADASVGGRLGTTLKRAGWDGVVFTGRSEAPVGLTIDDEEIAFASATSFVPQETGARFAALDEWGAVATVGPAANHGVRFANVMVDGGYAAGRGGLGLCFAAKGLQYVAVRGSGRVAVADPEALRRVREEIFRLADASPILTGEYGLKRYGTGALYDLIHSRRMMPTDNFRATHFAPAPSLNAVAYERRYTPRKGGCLGCTVRCKRSAAADGRHLPEFETMAHFTALLGNTDLELVMAANARCNELGMDTISAGVTLACHAELSGQALSPARVLALLDEIGGGRGEGRALGEGSLRYARAAGRPEAAMAVKGQELPAYDPRGAYGMALGYVTSTRGGCHLRAYPISHEILRKPVATDRFTFSGKARVIKISEDKNAVVDSLTACKFLFFAATLEEYAKAYSAVTGRPASTHDLMLVGERIDYQERMMNARNGFAARDDDLPPRFFTEPGTSGNRVEVPPLDRAAFLAARAAYYRVRGLDEEGRPLRARAEALELAWIDS